VEVDLGDGADIWGAQVERVVVDAAHGPLVEQLDGALAPMAWAPSQRVSRRAAWGRLTSTQRGLLLRTAAKKIRALREWRASSGGRLDPRTPAFLVEALGPPPAEEDAPELWLGMVGTAAAAASAAASAVREQPLSAEWSSWRPCQREAWLQQEFGARTEEEASQDGVLAKRATVDPVPRDRGTCVTNAGNPFMQAGYPFLLMGNDVVDGKWTW